MCFISNHCIVEWFNTNTLSSTKARQAVLQRLTPEELGVNVTQHVKVVEVNEPPKRAAGIKVQEPQDIVENLKKLKAF